MAKAKTKRATGPNPAMIKAAAKNLPGGTGKKGPSTRIGGTTVANAMKGMSKRDQSQFKAGAKMGLDGNPKPTGKGINKAFLKGHAAGRQGFKNKAYGTTLKGVIGRGGQGSNE